MKKIQYYSVPIALIILCFFVFQGRLFAFTNISADALGRAGAGVAANNVHDVYGLNPSSMLFSQYYSLGGSYNSLGNSVKGSIVDTKTSAIGGGISYVHRLTQLDSLEEFVEFGAQLALAGRPLPELSFGLLTKTFWVKEKGKKERKAKLDFDLGFKYDISETLAVGAVVRHLIFIPKEEEFPSPNLAFGVAYTPMPTLTLMLDGGTWWKEEAKELKGAWQAVIAAEFTPIPVVQLRGGFRFVSKKEKKRAFAAGIKLNFETFEIAYGGEVFFAADPVEYDHSVTLTLIL